VTAWAAALAAAQGRPCALALLDVDGMSGLGEALGPARGDALLRAVAERLRGVLTDQAHLARWAGDLFGVALPGVDVEQAVGLLERARMAVSARPFKLGRGPEAREVAATVSVGLAAVPRDAPDLAGLLDAARAALWRAKGLGGDRLGLPARERMVLKTSYYPQRQLEQLKRAAARVGVSEAVLLREALDELLLRKKAVRALPAPGAEARPPARRGRRPASG
jgi:diguanylate cyclase (GGDEF)-like protein